MKKICLVIAPTNKCNLKCDYCYNCELDGLYKDQIDLDLIKHIIDMAFREYQYVDFVWRGGEPLLVKRKLYRKIFVEQLKAAQKYGTHFHNSIQTNGTLIDKHWLSFIKAFRFDLGISYDGEYSDIHRGRSTETTRGVLLSNKKRIKNIGCISVITNENIDLIQLYLHLSRELHFSSIKLSPCFKTIQTDYSVDVNRYISELKKLFEFWLFDTYRVDIKPITDFVRAVLGICNIRQCVHAACLGKFLDIDSNGVLRICSHITDDSVILGDIRQYGSISEIFNTDKFNTALVEMIKRREICKNNCEIFSFCQGGCYAEVYMQKQTSSNDFSCTVNKSLFPFIKSKVTEIIYTKEDVSKYNPVFLELIMEAIAMNPTFFK